MVPSPVKRAILCAVTLGLATLARSASAQTEEPQDRSTGAVPHGSSGAVIKPPEEAPAKPVIVPPKLVHFEHAPYPPQALKAGLQADVILVLTIDKQGDVTKADVSTPAGHGFDEAAQAAALKFKFEPATRNDKPVPAKIEYRYAFTLTPAEAAPAAARPPPPPKPTKGNLGGLVRIAGTNVPLAGAEVVVEAEGVEPRRLAADAVGKWTIQGLPPGKYKVRVAAAGYEATENEEEVTAGEATEVTYRLAPEAEGIEVTVRGERPAREVTRRTLEQREIARIPGTGGDALRSLQSLPGVARAPGLAGILIVRGSAPQDTLTFVDGTDVPIIYHFGGLSSVVPTELLDRIDFYPGNFSARYGRRQGGIVDVALRSPNTNCRGPYGKPSDEKGCYHGFAELDLINGRFLLEGPIGKKWSFVAAARRSWIDTWLGPVLEAAGAGVTTAPVYYDYQLIAETRPTRQSKLSLRAFGADDRLALLIKNPAAEDPGFSGNLTFGTAFYRLQALYEHRLTPDIKLTSMVSGGKDALKFSIGSIQFQLTDYPISMRNELSVKLAEPATLNFGMDLVSAPYDFSVRLPSLPSPGQPDPGPFSARPLLERKASGIANRPGWYVEAEVRATQRLRLVPSLRLDYARDSGHVDASPRLNARYDLISSRLDTDETGAARRRTTLKGGIGIFRQPPQFQETDLVYGTANLLSNNALHTSVGVEQEITRQVELSLEGFYKDLSRQVTGAPGPTGGTIYTNRGVGYVVGLETLLKYKPDRRFFGWLAYTLSRSIRQNNKDAPEYLFQFDQTHNLTVLGSYRLGRGWEFGARFRLISGNLVTPVVGLPSLPALYAADAGSYAPQQGQLNSRRMPLFHQLDLRIDKRWQFEVWQLVWYLDVQNAYNHASVEGVDYNYNYSRSQYISGIPILPSLGLRGEF
jgi:TonB family protein